MPHHIKKVNDLQQIFLSKHIDHLQENFTPVFFRNQFRTKKKSTKALYSNVAGERAMISGANTGSVLEAARQLMGLGLSHFVMGVWSPARGKVAAKVL